MAKKKMSVKTVRVEKMSETEMADVSSTSVRRMKPVTVPCKALPARRYKELVMLRREQKLPISRISIRSGKKKTKKVKDKRVQVTIRIPGNWMICLKVPFELYERIMAFEEATHCKINDKFKDIFDDGIISEENIKDFLSNNRY